MRREAVADARPVALVRRDEEIRNRLDDVGAVAHRISFMRGLGLENCQTLVARPSGPISNVNVSPSVSSSRTRRNLLSPTFRNRSMSLIGSIVGIETAASS